MVLTVPALLAHQRIAGLDQFVGPLRRGVPGSLPRFPVRSLRLVNFGPLAAGGAIFGMRLPDDRRSHDAISFQSRASGKTGGAKSSAVVTSSTMS